jgi:hypothetical protein
MNRKQRRRWRKHRNKEGHLRNRKHWAPLGPPVVMDDPTPEHVKALLMEWLAPRGVLYEVEKELGQRYVQKLDDKILEVLVGKDVTGTSAADLWCHLMQGITVKATMPPRIALA